MEGTNSNLEKFTSENTNNKEPEENVNVLQEKFVIEYPLNYNEIVDRKLQMLEKEYADVIRCDFKVEEVESKMSEESEENEGEPENANDGYANLGDNNYQCLNECEEDFVEVNEDCKNEETNCIGSNMYIQSDIINNEEEFEFVTKSEDNLDNIPEQKVETVKSENAEPSGSASVNSKPFVPRSPIKDPEKIKNAMKQVKMNPPKWAENLSDEDFVNMVKKIVAKTG